MGHHGHHHHRTSSLSRKLILSSAATIVFLIVEVAVGVLSGSLALVGDALHNFTDSLALLLALFAVRLERRPATSQKSYGYQRAGILAAFINAAGLVGLTIFIFIEAVERFQDPRPVDDVAMIVTASLGILLNLAITMSLRREGERDVNVRSAVVHMIGDAISSAGIIIAAILIRTTGTVQWDPVVSVLIACLIIWSSWGILRETMNLLLEGTPRGIDPQSVIDSLGSIEGVYGVHHLHIWALGPSSPALSCHLMVGDVPVRNTAALLQQVTEMLENEHGIIHATVQFEFANCAVDDPFCVPYPEEARAQSSEVRGAR
jgi:cobalt-zinc-cadmium efflux system protein